MKKAFDQTVRDIRRGVNKKVLKVPGIEQKVLDATSNEPWGPHGSLLADIAQATRNYHEYQMIMTIIWKRINDTGKNWRHVYKGLTVLEYLVANGSERVIDEIREHAYQISTLSDFQYIDSSGRDQGNNVRKKSQSLVALVNDKERIADVRQKAAANRDKFRSASSGGMYRPGSNSSSGGYVDRYDDDRYGSRDGERNGFGRQREGGYRDDDRYGRYGDSYSHDGDHYGRDNEDRYSRDGYRDDDHCGRTRTIDDYQSGSRSRSSEGYQGRSCDDDGQYSSRDSGVKADNVSQNGRGLEQRNSEQNVGAPPSYGEAINEAQSPVYSERNGEKAASPAPRESSPTTSYSPTQANAAFSNMGADGSDHGTTSINQDDKVFDEFDPRGPVSAAPATNAASTAAAIPAAPVTQSSSNSELDLLGSLSDSFALAIVPAAAVAVASETSVNGENFGTTSSVSNIVNQSFEDPFGDGLFSAIPSSETVVPPQTSTSTDRNDNIQSNKPGVPNFGFGDSFSVTRYSASGVHDVQHRANTQFASQGSSNLSQEIDILADILPPTQSPVVSQSSFTGSTGQATPIPFSAPTGGYQQSFSSPSGQPSEQPFSVSTVHVAPQTFSALAGQHTEDTEQSSTFSHTGQTPQASGGIYGGFSSQVGSLLPAGPATAPQAQTGYSGQVSGANFLPQVSPHVPSYVGNQPLAGPNAQGPSYFLQQGGSTAQLPSQVALQSPNGPLARYNSGSFTSQQGIRCAVSSPVSQSAPSTSPLGRQSSGNVGILFGQTGATSLNAPQQSKDKFETKSTVWADTLSRGLVDLNISGSKTNPLSDIGVDFEAINRKDKRMEKPSTTPVVSTVNMGKAMGAGSGIGRASGGALRAPPNPMIGSAIGMGVGGNPAMGMGSYGGMNPSMGMGIGMGMMGMGMVQGAPMQPPSGFPPGANMSGTYNPMMGRGGYGPQQPPYGGYR